MKDFIFQTILMSLQNTMLQYAPLIITTGITALTTWTIKKINLFLSSNAKLKNIQISKELEEAILKEALKTALYIEQKFSNKIADNVSKQSLAKKDEATAILSMKFPELNPAEVSRLIETVLPDVRTIVNPNNPSMLVK